MHQLVCVLVVSILFNFPTSHGSTIGKEFVIGHLRWHDSFELKIDIASTTHGHFHLYVPHLGINSTKPFNKTSSFSLLRVGMSDTKIEQKGVFIKSDTDISVYATSVFAYGEYADTYVVIPVDSLGNEYEIASYKANYGDLDPSVFMVIAAFDNTSINVSFPNGTSTSKTLNWLDIYQAASPWGEDLTGTLVQSNKPVSVISGASFSHILDSHTYDFFGDQLLPLNAFESKFIVPPIYNSQTFMIRIFNSQRTNRVCVKDASFENCTILGPTKWIESAPKSTPLIVTSQEPISVVQYKERFPYMTTIPGIQQFMNSYAFVVPNVYRSQTTYVAITILSTAMHTLLLDGRSPADQIVDHANVPAPFNEYTVLTCEITSGYHVMTSTATNVMFGLLMFGHVDSPQSSFANPVGMLMRSDLQLMCYNCDDKSDLAMCSTVQRCAPGQLCSIEEFDLLGHAHFKQGCAEASCTAIEHGHSVPRCKSCCREDFCNTNCTMRHGVEIIG